MYLIANSMHALAFVAVCLAPTLARTGDGSNEQKVQVARRLVDLADREANGIKDRAGAYGRAARLFVDAGQRTEALDVIAKAEAMLDQAPVEPGNPVLDLNLRLFRRLYLAEWRYEIGEREAAAASLKRALSWWLDRDEVPLYPQKTAMVPRCVRAAYLARDLETARELTAAFRDWIAKFDDAARAQLDSSFDYHLFAADGNYRRLLDAIVTDAPPPRSTPEGHKNLLLTLLVQAADPREADELGPILDEALPLVYGIADAERRAEMLIQFANAQTTLKRFDHSINILETVSFENVPEDAEDTTRQNKAMALATLSEAMANARKRAESGPLLDEAIELCMGAKGRGATQSRAQIRQACARLGETEKILASIETLSAEEQRLARMMYAEGLVSRGRLADAQQALAPLMTEALAGLDALSSKPEAAPEPARVNPRTVAMARLCMMQAMSGDFEAAARTIAEIDDPTVKRGSYAAVPRSMLPHRGLNDTLAWIDAIDDPEVRFRALITLVAALLGSGQIF